MVDDLINTSTGGGVVDDLINNSTSTLNNYNLTQFID